MALKDVVREVEDDEEEMGADSLLSPKVLGEIDLFNNFFSSVEDSILERDAETMQMRLALLTKQHIFLQGLPGTAKSLLARRVLGNIMVTDKDTGEARSSVFAIQMTKGMGDEYLFGGIDIKELKESGKIMHRLEGMITRRRFAFIDEAFDANDNTLRSMLELLNERTFTRGTQREKAILHTAILTSNYRRETEITQAVLDRILFKAEVKKVTAKKNRMAMYMAHLAGRDMTEVPPFPYKTLSLLERAARKVTVEDDVLDLYDEVLREFEDESKIYVSDRKANLVLNVLRAQALLNKRNLVTVDDMEALRYVLIVANDAKQEEMLMAVLKKTIGVLKDRQMQMKHLSLVKKEHEALKGLYKKFDDLDDKSKVALSKRVKDQVGALQQRPRPSQQHDDIEHTYTEIMALDEKMLKEGLAKMGLS